MKSLHLITVILCLFITTAFHTPLQSQSSLPAGDIITPENASDVVQQHIIGNGRVFDIVLSPLGDTFALPGYFGIWIHEIDNPSAPPVLLDEGGAGIYEVAYSPDGRFIASVSVDDVLTLWDINTQTPVYRLENLPTFDMKYSPDGRFIVNVDYDGNVTIIKAINGEIINQISLPERVSQMAYHPNGTEIAFAMESIGIQILDMSNPYEPVLDIRFADFLPIYILDYNPTGDKLLAYRFEEVMIWDMSREKRGTLIQTIAQDTYIWDRDVEFDNTGEHFFVASENGRLSIYNTNTGEFEGSLAHPQALRSATLSPDGTLYTLANGTIYAWDYETRTLKYTYDNDYLSEAAGTVAFNPSMTQMAIAKGYQIELLETATWQTTDTLDSNTAIGQILYITEDQFVTNGSSVSLWNGGNEQVIRAFDSPYNHIAVSPKQDTVAIGVYEDGILLVDPQSGEVITRIPQQGDPFDDSRSGPNMSIVFTPDGLAVAWVYVGNIYVWDINNRSLRYQIDNISVDWLDYHSSGNFWVGGVWDMEHMVAIWDATTGEEIRRFDTFPSAGYNLRTGKLSPDGRVLAIVEDNIYLFNFETGELLATISDHMAPVIDITFSADGRYLTSNSFDGTIRIWGVGG
ncbi:MAG: WD40 repeat domain-containing protein [bacterium]|nr:WD40 repeat domain-containing protein [bacterium]